MEYLVSSDIIASANADSHAAHTPKTSEQSSESSISAPVDGNDASAHLQQRSDPLTTQEIQVPSLATPSTPASDQFALTVAASACDATAPGQVPEAATPQATTVSTTDHVADTSDAIDVDIPDDIMGESTDSQCL